MTGKFVHKKFSDIDINDPFFDSLKQDYPKTSTSAEFTEWFSRKSTEGKEALVFEDNIGIGAFVNIKPGETEEIVLSNGKILPLDSRLKITTIKIDEITKGSAKVHLD